MAFGFQMWILLLVVFEGPNKPKSFYNSMKILIINKSWRMSLQLINGHYTYKAVELWKTSEFVLFCIC